MRESAHGRAWHGAANAATNAAVQGQQVASAPAGTSAKSGNGRIRSYRLPRVRRRMLFSAVFVGPVIVYALLFFAYPLAYGIVMSFEKLDFAGIVNGSGPFVGFSNYAAEFSDPVTLIAIRNTVIFVVASLVFQIGFGLALALLLNQKFFLSRFLQRIVLMPWLVPLIAGGTIFSILFGDQGGLINIVLTKAHVVSGPVPWLISSGPALAAIILVNIWAGLPFNIIVLYSGLQDIDPTLHEAAMVDGAGPWQKLRRVTIPLLRPVLLIVVMLGAIGTIKVFDIVWVMTGAGPNNATQLMSTWSYTQAFTNFNFGEGAAIGDTLLVFSFILSLLYLRTLRIRDGR